MAQKNVSKTKVIPPQPKRKFLSALFPVFKVHGRVESLQFTVYDQNERLLLIFITF